MISLINTFMFPPLICRTCTSPSAGKPTINQLRPPIGDRRVIPHEEQKERNIILMLSVTSTLWQRATPHNILLTESCPKQSQGWGGFDGKAACFVSLSVLSPNTCSWRILLLEAYSSLHFLSSPVYPGNLGTL